MKRPVLGVLLLCAAVPALADGIQVRIMPPDKAQFLQYQTFDLRVEATGAATTDTVSTLRVELDGVDVTSRGAVTPGATANVRNWTYRDAALGIEGPRVLTASAGGTSGGAAITGQATVTVAVRKWDQSKAKPRTTRALDEAEAFQAVALRAALRQGERADEDGLLREAHLGALHPALQRAGALADPPLPRAKNVILFIGDGMGAAHRTAARVLSKGYTQGKANGTLAMDRFPFNGLMMTSSLDSLVTDSAPGAHCYSTGNKTNNGMEGVFPDNTAAEDDNPRLEHLSMLINRFLGKVTGIVSDAFATDATLAAFLAHTQNRGNGTLIASQYFDLRKATGLKVLMGGGSYHFIPKSRTGSKRTDERDVIAAFQGDGWSFVDSKTALAGYVPSGSEPRLLGLFNLDNMNVAFDKLGMGDANVVGSFTDQPFLKEMTQKAIDVLSRYPDGFFLMVEGAHIDKQAHRMDAERSVYDVIQLDQAVQVALDFAMRTNGDADPDNDTLVVVTADHECSGLVLPGVGRPEKKGTRDYVKAYNYSASGNNTSVPNFPDYVDANGDGYPDNPGTLRKLIVSFGASPDHYEDWTVSPRPRNASATEGSGYEPGVLQGGVAVANPSDPKKGTPGALLLGGILENGASGGEAQVQAVHTLSDIPVSAFGPGASQLARVNDNTEGFFAIFNAMLGTYPVPVRF